MARIKGGVVTKRKHKKILKLAKGYWMSRSKQIKKAKEAVLHAGEYAFAGRKKRKRNFRSLWITRISAALSDKKMNYSHFVNMLREKNIALDRKILAQIVVEYPSLFNQLVKTISDKREYES